MNDNLKSNSLVTFAVIAFNQEEYIKEAMVSALKQTYHPIQFVFSDDCSSDRTFDIMCDIAAQDERSENIILNRNDRNLGIVNHVNKISMELARGKYIVLLAGDDISSADRTKKVVACFEATGASAVAVNPVMIDRKGNVSNRRFFPRFPTGVLHLDGFLDHGSVFFGGGGYSREIFDVYGPMQRNVRNEDQILPLRASTLGGIAYLPDPVFYYREHSNNFSFWAKKKVDPKNKVHYEIEERKNALQNYKNFKQDFLKHFHSTNNNNTLKWIDMRIVLLDFEVAMLQSRTLRRLARIPDVLRIGRNLKQRIALFLICISPKLYFIALSIRMRSIHR